MKAQTKANIIGCICGVLAGTAYMCIVNSVLGCSHRNEPVYRAVAVEVRPIDAKTKAEIEKAASEMRGVSSHIVFPPTPNQK